jgi:hypothetical protein
MVVPVEKSIYRLARFSFFSSDDNHAVRSARTVDSARCRSFQEADVIDEVRVDIVCAVTKVEVIASEPLRALLRGTPSIIYNGWLLPPDKGGVAAQDNLGRAAGTEPETLEMLTPAILACKPPKGFIAAERLISSLRTVVCA